MLRTTTRPALDAPQIETFEKNMFRKWWKSLGKQGSVVNKKAKLSISDKLVPLSVVAQNTMNLQARSIRLVIEI